MNKKHSALHKLRLIQPFNPKLYLEAKQNLLKRFFEKKILKNIDFNIYIDSRQPTFQLIKNVLSFLPKKFITANPQNAIKIVGYPKEDLLSRDKNSIQSSDFNIFQDIFITELTQLANLLNIEIDWPMPLDSKTLCQYESILRLKLIPTQSEFDFYLGLFEFDEAESLNKILRIWQNENRLSIYHSDMFDVYPNSFTNKTGNPVAMLFPNASKNLNFFTLSDLYLSYEHEIISSKRILAIPRGNLHEIEGILSTSEIRSIVKEVDENGWTPILIGGSKHTISNQNDKVGSFRASTINNHLASIIWNRLAPYFGGLRKFSEESLIDKEQHSYWCAVGVSPLLRFVKYEDGCEALLPHYDESIIQPDGSKALMRVLIYLNTNELLGGDTIFVKEPEVNLPFSQMSLQNWNREPYDDEIIYEVSPKPGLALVFDHKLLHGSKRVSETGSKITLRTDILFVKCSYIDE